MGVLWLLRLLPLSTRYNDIIARTEAAVIFSASGAAWPGQIHSHHQFQPFIRIHDCALRHIVITLLRFISSQEHTYGSAVTSGHTDVFS